MISFAHDSPNIKGKVAEIQTIMVLFFPLLMAATTENRSFCKCLEIEYWPRVSAPNPKHEETKIAAYNMWGILAEY